MSAKDLIKKAMERKTGRHIPDRVLAELKAVLDHNDKHPQHRVMAKDALILLRNGGVRCATTTTLLAICREQLGRKSWLVK